MKKLLTSLIFAIAALLLVSCGGGKDYRNAIPANAFVVMSANPKAIANKAQVGDFTQSPLYRHLETAFADESDFAPEVREYILSLIAEPSKSGLSMDHDCFLFMQGENFERGDFNVGILLKVKDRKDLDKFADFIVEQSGMERQMEGGITTIFEKDDWSTQAIAYNNEAFIAYFSPKGYEVKLPELKGYFGQKKAESIMGRQSVASALDGNNDMMSVLSYSALNPMLQQMGMGEGFEWASKMIVTMPANFEKGAIVANVNVLFEDKDAEKQFMDMGAITGKFSGEALKLLPAGSVAALGSALKGAQLYTTLEKIPMYSMLLAMAPQAKPIMEAIDGDLMLSFNRMSEDGSYPLATLTIDVTDENVVTTIRDLAASGEILLKEVAPGDFEGVINNVPVWFGRKNTMLYISTDGGFIDNLRNGTETSFKDMYGDLFRDSYGAFVIDAVAMRGMLETMIANNGLNPEVGMILPYLGLFEDLQVNNRTLTEAKMVINMTDKEKNAAEVIYRAIEQAINMAIGMDGCC